MNLQYRKDSTDEKYNRDRHTNELLIAEDVERAIEIVKNKYKDATFIKIHNITHRGQLTID